jgi:hypothetical protein
MTLLFNCEGKDSFTPRNSSHQNINEQRSLELGFWDLQFSNVVRGSRLVLHDPEGSHYKNAGWGQQINLVAEFIYAKPVCHSEWSEAE